MAETELSSSAQEVAQAALALVTSRPGARIFIYVDTGAETEATVFASGTDDEAADIMLSVGEWLDADDDEDDDD